MVHLSKLAVGIRDIDHLRAAQAERTRLEGVLRHRTRMAPRRRDALLDGGSIYWVVAGVMQVRQPIRALEAATREDGAPCVALVLDPALVQVVARALRPFQGWRYLEGADAPPDLDSTGGARGERDLPAGLRRRLLELALL